MSNSWGSLHPWGLGRGIHAADTPAPPTHPALDSFLRRLPRKITNKGKSGSLRSQSRGRQPTAFAVASAFFPDLPVVDRRQESVRGRAGGVRRGVSAMGPRHASGGLGRTPNPGLAVCAGQRTRAWRARAYKDVFTASPAQPTRPANPQRCSSSRPTNPSTEGPRRSPIPAEGALSAGKIVRTTVSILAPLVRCKREGHAPAAQRRPQ